MELQLTDQVALVLAGSKGLGFATAKTLLHEGAKVVICSHDQTNLNAAIAQLDSPNVHAVLCDVNDPAAIKALVAETIAYFGPINILVNNAGGPRAAVFEELDDEAWLHAFNQNLLSNIRTIRAALPSLKQTHGAIINIASSSVKEPIPGLILSNVMRAGVANLAKTLSKEFGQYGITVNTVAPGRIATARIEALDAARAAATGVAVADLQAASKQTIPLGRFGTPQEFANAVVFLASPAGRYINGQTLIVDGGSSHAL
ncbi:SDR family oxidoreductase [Lacticaseibacillus baoqingensis]|uniref:SDR family oxidoreductase n=1 Tax=Lacticaseibacillus baoqingensis TaxID=2486013 RepID=A0ABW4E487_9LACO|nr:SDR family oxidoreductase [Lacticaseibacillus baoqingensis]